MWSALSEKLPPGEPDEDVDLRYEVRWNALKSFGARPDVVNRWRSLARWRMETATTWGGPVGVKVSR